MPDGAQAQHPVGLQGAGPSSAGVDILEGGEVRPLEDYRVEAKRHHAQTARTLAYALVGIFAGVIVLHYGGSLVLIFMGRSDGLAALDRAFNNLFPALTTLVGGALTYYFTKERKDE